MGPGLERLAQSITAPRYFIKLWGDADDLRAALPAGWGLHTASYFMQADGVPCGGAAIKGYTIDVTRVGMLTQAHIFSGSGALAASGHAAETPDAFVYDRIVTEPLHRRKGLGLAIMATLQACKRHPDSPELLLATPDGQTLYSALG